MAAEQKLAERLLLALAPAGKVRPVRPEHGREDQRQRDRAVPVTRPQQVERRIDQRRQQRQDARPVPDHADDKHQRQQRQHELRRQAEHRAAQAGRPLPAAEAQKHGENVPQHAQQPGQRRAQRRKQQAQRERHDKSLGKDAFFPQSETLYTCVRDGKKLTVEPEELRSRPFVVFGMKACDVKGVAVLDKVFLADPVDTFYAARRDHGTIVAMACHEPEESCFCKVFGTDAADPEADADVKGIADVAAWMVEGSLYWKALTEKGEALTEAVKELLIPADDDQVKVDAEKEAIRAIVEKLPYTHLSLEGWDGNATDEKFNSPVWETLYKPCLACGTCTFVCPTCQCYDIKDYDTGHGVKRYRCWDSCMYSDFTMMAHGNNRTSQMQRFRQRFMHKLVYFPANNDGMYSCVGCGRCVEKCPSSLNIVKVIKAFEKHGGEK